MTTRGGIIAVLTGFGPFPGVPVNATMLLVPRLAAAARQLFPGTEFVADILPTEWSAAPVRVDRLIAHHNPDLMVHFGVSGRARGFEIERRGHNARARTPDAAGCHPETRNVRAEMRVRRPVRLPVAEIVRRLRRRGLPAYQSWSAGTYLCNATLYHSLAATEPSACAVGFVHLPSTLAPRALARDPRVPFRASPGCPLTWDEALEGALDILATCLNRPSPAQGSLARIIATGG